MTQAQDHEPGRQSNRVLWGCATRQERARWVAEKYAPFLYDSVLDVGCWMGHLRTYLQAGVKYVGVDIDGAPDVLLNLDQGTLPFRDRAFETVVCTEVLEHLDKPHAVFDEMLRVAKTWVIISLPNVYSLLKWQVATGSLTSPKFYGLPVEPPMDRHRWFFNYTQAAEFVEGRARLNGASIHELEARIDGPRSLKGFVKWLLVRNPQRRCNLFASALWAVVRKGG